MLQNIILLDSVVRCFLINGHEEPTNDLQGQQNPFQKYTYIEFSTIPEDHCIGKLPPFPKTIQTEYQAQKWSAQVPDRLTQFFGSNGKLNLTNISSLISAAIETITELSQQSEEIVSFFNFFLF